MLSEKAKGKQRAVERESDGSSSSNAQVPSAQNVELPKAAFVRFTEGGLSDLSVTIRPLDNVGSLKPIIRNHRHSLQKRRLRLIYSGRMLMDSEILYNILPNVSSGDSSKQTQPIYIHCSVGQEMQSEQVDNDIQHSQQQMRPVRGFDRLAALGFSEDDINNFRRQFHSQSSNNYLDTEFTNDEEYESHLHSLEEQWIDSLDTPNTAAISQIQSSSSASDISVLQGTLIGFFFPILPFFFMKEPERAVFWENGASSREGGFGSSGGVLGRRISMGIVVGMVVNVLFGLWRYLLDSS